MDEEIIETVKVSAETVWHPILRTCREEIASTCRSAESNWMLLAIDGESLAKLVEASPENTVCEIARTAGYYLMEGGDYWSALPLAAECVLDRTEHTSPASLLRS